MEIINEEVKEVKPENQIVEANEQQTAVANQPINTAPAGLLWADTTVFNNTYKMASYLAKSDLVPQAYRNSPSNCLLAIDIALRMNTSPFVVMQYSQIVRGKFTWSGSACRSMIDSCGKYKKTRYVEVGERGKDTWGFYLQAVDLDGETINGVTVTMAMAKAEDWFAKDGSKWKTMPELMLQYRAAAFFMRTQCPSVAMGYLTAEEVEDITPADEQSKINKFIKKENK